MVAPTRCCSAKRESSTSMSRAMRLQKFRYRRSDALCRLDENRVLQTLEDNKLRVRQRVSDLLIQSRIAPAVELARENERRRGYLVEPRAHFGACVDAEHVQEDLRVGRNHLALACLDDLRMLGLEL